MELVWTEGNLGTVYDPVIGTFVHNGKLHVVIEPKISNTYSTERYRIVEWADGMAFMPQA